MKDTPTNVLPHNPLTKKGLMEEVKKLKGEGKPWLQFDLECILAKYPGNKKLAAVLAEVTAKVAEADKPKQASKQEDSKPNT